MLHNDLLFTSKITLCGARGYLCKVLVGKNANRKGLHWCDWMKLCFPKEAGGLNFRSFAHFNLALLAKQGWRLINFPDSLLARSLKAKYYRDTDFLGAKLGNSHHLPGEVSGLQGVCWSLLESW